MTPTQILEALPKIGLYGELRATGHPDYARLFVLEAQADGIPISHGRITVFQGAYSHIKWYGESFNMDPKHGSSFYIHAWSLLLETGEVLTRERYATATQRATVRAAAVVAKKQEWRDANPKSKGGRVRLQPPNPQRFLAEEIRK
jgi:hypothetical protein